VGLSVCTAWQGITRPLTAIAFALPAAAVILRVVHRERRWGQLVEPMVVGGVILALLPLWSYETVGSWRTTPYALYSRFYMPSERAGFGAVAAQPERPLVPEVRCAESQWRTVHSAHRPEKLPQIVGERLLHVDRDFFPLARSGLLLFAVLGVVGLRSAAWLPVVTAVALVGCYLAYAHPPSWTVYYVEMQPVLAFLTALGLWQVAVSGSSLEHGARELGHDSAERARRAAFLMAVLAVLPVAWSLDGLRADERMGAEYRSAFRGQVARLPGDRLIVFVRYQSSIQCPSLIYNEPDLASARVWVVNDRGADDARLMEMAPDRTAYLYIDRNRTFMRLGR
jgi:hypothetical protein